MKTPFQYWLEENETDLRDAWDSMGYVEKMEEGGWFIAFCENQFKQREVDCHECGDPCETRMEKYEELCSTHLESHIYSLKN